MYLKSTTLKKSVRAYISLYAHNPKPRAPLLQEIFPLECEEENTKIPKNREYVRKCIQINREPPVQKCEVEFAADHSNFLPL